MKYIKILLLLLLLPVAVFANDLQKDNIYYTAYKLAIQKCRYADRNELGCKAWAIDEVGRNKCVSDCTEKEIVRYIKILMQAGKEK